MICACCCKDKDCADTSSGGVTVRHCMDCLYIARKMLTAAHAVVARSTAYAEFKARKLALGVQSYACRICGKLCKSEGIPAGWFSRPVSDTFFCSRECIEADMRSVDDHGSCSPTSVDRATDTPASTSARP